MESKDRREEIIFSEYNAWKMKIPEEMSTAQEISKVLED
jgi:hypothetical protein